MSLPLKAKPSPRELSTEQAIREEAHVVSLSPRWISQQPSETPVKVSNIRSSHHKEAIWPQTLPEAVQEDVCVEDMLDDLQQERRIVAIWLEKLCQRHITVVLVGHKAEFSSTGNVGRVNIEKLHLVPLLPEEKGHFGSPTTDIQHPERSPSGSPAEEL